MLFTCDFQPEKVKFLLRLGQSKPLYNAFKAIQESPDWNTLSDARKRIVECKYMSNAFIIIILEVSVLNLVFVFHSFWL